MAHDLQDIADSSIRLYANMLTSSKCMASPQLNHALIVVARIAGRLSADPAGRIPLRGNVRRNATQPQSRGGLQGGGVASLHRPVRGSLFPAP